MRENVPREQLLRDLQWIVDCPSLISKKTAFTLPPLPPVEALDLAPVEEFLQSKIGHRVGNYFEALIEVWLRAVPEVESLESGLVIQGEKRTLGELDFLFRHRDRLIHLEIALKFYLFYGPEHESGSHFIGPNSSDNFERKRDTLSTKQIPFGLVHFPEIEESRVLVKGQVFYHPEQVEEVALPSSLATDHRRGVWIRESELGYFAKFSGDDSGTVLEKPFWLAAFGDSVRIGDLVEGLKKHFEERRHPVLLSVRAGESERERVFVVPDTWP